MKKKKKKISKRHVKAEDLHRLGMLIVLNYCPPSLFKCSHPQVKKFTSISNAKQHSTSSVAQGPSPPPALHVFFEIMPFSISKLFPSGCSVYSAPARPLSPSSTPTVRSRPKSRVMPVMRTRTPSWVVRVTSWLLLQRFLIFFFLLRKVKI